MESHLENNREMNTQNKCTVRTRILGIISKNPGICFSTIKERTRNGNGTVYFHLRVLENERKIISRKISNRRLFWSRDFRGIPRNSYLHGVCRQIIESLEKHSEGMSVGALARALGTSHSRVCYHLNTLRMKGLVVRRKVGRKTICYLKEGVGGIE